MCPICLSLLKENSEMTLHTINNVSHKFHESCLSAAVKINCTNLEKLDGVNRDVINNHCTKCKKNQINFDSNTCALSEYDITAIKINNNIISLELINGVWLFNEELSFDYTTDTDLFELIKQKFKENNNIIISLQQTKEDIESHIDLFKNTNNTHFIKLLWYNTTCKMNYKSKKYSATVTGESLTFNISPINESELSTVNLNIPADIVKKIKYLDDITTLEIIFNDVHYNQSYNILGLHLKYNNQSIEFAFPTDSNYSDLSLDICKQVFENDADATKVYSTFRMFVPLLPDNVLEHIKAADSVADKLPVAWAEAKAKAAAALLAQKQNEKRGLLSSRPK